MNNSEESFRKKLNGLLDEPHYGYDAANWDAASKHLDEEDKKKRFFWIFFSGLGVGLIVVGYILFPINDTKTISDNKGTKTNHVPIEIEKNSRTDSENKGIKKADLFPIDFHKNLPSSVKQVALPTDGNSPIASTTSSSVVVKQSKPEVELKIKVSEKSITPDSDPLPLSNTKRTSDLKVVMIPSSEKKTDLLHYNPLQNESDITKNNFSSKTPMVEEVNQSPEKSEFGSEVNDEVKIDTLTSKTKESITSKEDTSLNRSMTQLQDSATITGVLPPAKLPATHFFYVEAGTCFNIGWKYQGRREGGSLNPYLGFGSLFNITDKAGFSIGIYYTTVSNLKNTKVIKASKVVFGEESEVTAVTPVTLNYLSVPLKLHYKLNEKNDLTGGCSFSYVLDAQSNVTKYTERAGMQENYTSYKTGGYTEGFKTFTSQLNIGYRRMLYANLWVNGEIFYGISDIRNDSFFGIKRNERLSGIKISLTYDLIKK